MVRRILYRRNPQPSSADSPCWRLTWTSSAGAVMNTTSYAYDAMGRLTRRTWARGVTTDYTYDGWGNMTNTVYSDGTPTITIAYDAMGRRTSVTDAAGTTSFVYDDHGSVTNEVWGGLGGRVLSRHWDRYGRNVGYSVDGVRKTELEHDLETGRIVTMDADGTFTWQYLQWTHLKSGVAYPNGENRPIRWTRGDTVVTMDFDSMGRRCFCRETENGEQVAFTRFFYDGHLMIQQLQPDSPYGVVKEFIWDPTESVATKPLCFREGGKDSAFLVHDGNKNVTDVIRVSPYNDSVAHYDYSPFGGVRSQSGARAFDNPFRFSSEFFDDSLGLVYYNYRHYNPMSGRWLSRDFLEEHASVMLYSVCGNSTINGCDVLGNDFINVVDGFSQTQVGKFLSCMGDCVAANDPIEKAINKFIAYAVAGVYPKSLVAGLLEATGKPDFAQLASKIRASARGRGARITNMESIIAMSLKDPAVKVTLRRLGNGLTKFNTLYGIYMLQVEAACAGACCGGGCRYDESVGVNLPFNAVVETIIKGLFDAFY